MSLSKPYDVFLAHNSADKPAVEELARVLRDERRMHVWFDVWKLRPGLSWQKAMEDGIRGSKSGAVLVGSDGIGPWENEEMEVLLQLAVREQLPVIPVLLPGAAAKPDLPVFLASRHYVDLRDGLTRDSVNQLVWGITGENPHDRPDLIATPSTSVDISRIVKYAPPELIGREQETALLDKTLAQMKRGTKTRPRVLTFVALGGEGKTSLVSKWVDGLDQKDWPGCEAAFAWSFYSQGSREQVAVSSDLFLAKALEFFGDAEMAASAQGAYEKGQRLARLVGDRKSVLVLDGLEPLQFPPSSATPGKLKDQGIEALLCGLARHSAGLCVVTTRFEIADVKSWPETAPQHELLRLSTQAGVDLLRSIRGKRQGASPPVERADEPDGSRRAATSPEPIRIQGTQAEFEALVEDVDGHALTLQILGQYLVRAHRGDIRRRDRIRFEKAQHSITGNVQFHADHAFRAIAAYEAWLADDSEESRRELAVLRLLGLFDRPATADCVQALLGAPAIDGLTDPLVGLPAEDWEFTLTTLSDARLVSVNRAEGTGELLSLDAHPLIREYFAMQLRRPDQAQRRSGNDATEDHANAGASSLRSSIRPTETAPTGQNISAQGNALGSRVTNDPSPEGATQRADVPPFQGSGDSDAAIPGALPQADMLRPVGAEATSEVWRAAHRRLYEHLCETTKEGDQPTLEDLQPLYQAVAHGCHAGLQQKACDDVYFGRILRGGESYSGNKLGAMASDLGATACFFDTPWSRVSTALTEGDQIWLMNEAGFTLRALGRLTEALEPMRVSGELDLKVDQWKGASASYSNLSELELTLGEVSGALSDAERSVTYADRSGDADMRMIMRTTHADALHQSGRRSEAESLFREAEQMQADDQPAYPLLYSLRGFRYCDLLLAPAEREAWRAFCEPLGVSPRALSGEDTQRPAAYASRLTSSDDSEPAHVPSASRDFRGAKGDSLEACRAVTDRATQTLKWEEAAGQGSLLTIALDHLSLARAALYQTILSHISFPGSAWERTAPKAPPHEQGAAPVGPVPTGRTDRDGDGGNGDGDGEDGRWEPALQEIAGAGLAGRANLGPAPASVRWEAARQEIEAAVSGLRRAGSMHHVPRGLLTRAWLRCLLSNLACQTAGEHETGLSAARTGPDSAQSDLDEAWEIASRGPMPLFMADIHLYRARLFGVGPVPTGRRDDGSIDQGDGRWEPALPYPWNSPEDDLAEARRLIEKHGYGRRMGELEDAERALLPGD